MVSRIVAVVLVFLVFKPAAIAQHEHMDAPGDSATVPLNMPGAILFSVPMSGEGSGTSWQPEASPMHMAVLVFAKWNVVVHGSFFLRYTHQGGIRGRGAFSGPNWIMTSAQRMIGEDSQIMFRTMLSLDRVTEGGDGYPLLLQSGETWLGKPLIDQQHPHDLFAEVAGAFSLRLSNDLGGYVYLGYPGEPALGPPAFMHRPSATYGPDAPIGHHWQDATHISFGVATAGLAMSTVKVEGSLFTGREPDENRFNFDKPRFDSHSWRISFNPSKELAFQVSRGSIRSPEGDGNDVIRTTASVQSAAISEDTEWSNSFVWGQNDEHHGIQNSLLLESSLSVGKFAFYSRLERVEKTQEELGIFIDPDHKERVHQFSVGLVRALGSSVGFTVNLGVQGSLSLLPASLKPFYGDNPLSFQIFLQLMPIRHRDLQTEHNHH